MTWTALAGRALPVLAILALATAAASPSRASGTTGPFTAAQASAGAKAYDQNCARCHGAKLQGISAPALSGSASGLKGDSVSDAYTFISNQMPAGNPGSLSSTDYVNITSYILSKNGHPAGTTKLTPALAKKNKTTRV